MNIQQEEQNLKDLLVKNNLAPKNISMKFIKYIFGKIFSKDINQSYLLIMKNLRGSPDFQDKKGKKMIDEIEPLLYNSLLLDSVINYMKKNSGLKLLKSMPTQAQVEKMFEEDQEISLFAKPKRIINFDVFNNLKLYEVFEIFLSFHSFGRDVLILSIENVVSKYNVCKFNTVRTILNEIKKVNPKFLDRFNCLEGGESGLYYKNINKIRTKFEDKLSKLKDTSISKLAI